MGLLKGPNGILGQLVSHGVPRFSSAGSKYSMSTFPSGSQQLVDQAFPDGWRVSPLATAVSLTADSNDRFIPAKHLQFLSGAIVDTVVSGGRLLVTMPPAYGKSLLISTYTPLWFLENWPSKYVFNVGYGSDFAERWGREPLPHEGS